MKTLLLILSLLLPLSAIAEELTVHRGLPFRQTFRFYQDKAMTSPVDVTGWQFFLKLRKTPASPVLATCTVTITDAANGRIEATLDAETTAALDVTRCQWDLIGRDSAEFDQYLVGGHVSVITPNTDTP